MILKDLRDEPQALDLMWSLFDTSDLFLAHSSGVATHTTPPRLVLSGALGKRLQVKFRGLDTAFAAEVERRVRERIAAGEWDGDLHRIKDERYIVYGDYYFIPSPSFPKGKLGLFQTQRAFWYKATDNEDRRHVQETIAYWSCMGLREWALKHSGARVDMVYPESHGLTFERTYYFMKTLPDNVFVWRMKQNEVNL